MATAKTLFRVDINEDGDFNDADEDVSSNVRQFKYVGGKIVAKHRVDAASLEFVLKNDGHKYSPSKSTGVWHPFVKLSPIVWFMMGYPVDTFDAADATTLASRKPDFDDTFSAWEGDTSDFNVLSNKLRAGSAANLTAVLDFGEAHCFVGCQITRQGSNGGVVLRWSDASNYLLIRSDGTTLYLSKVDAGTMTTIDSASHTWTAGDEKWILAEMHGDAIRVAVDDVLVLSELTGAVTNFNNTASKHGIGGRGTDTGMRWNDFGGWRSMFYGRVDTVQPRPFRSRQYAYVRAFDDMERLSKHFVYRLAPASPTYPEDILGEILDGADFSTANRILGLPNAYDSNQGTVSASGSAAFTLDDTTQDFQEWITGEYLVRITDASGTTALGWIGPTDVDSDWTKVELYTNSGFGTLGYATSDSGFDETDTPLTYNVIWQPLTEDTLSRSALGRDALTEAYQVADDDVGLFFIDGSGFARYEPYLHRLPATGHHQTSLKTWFASKQTPAESDIYFDDLIWDDGKDRAENEVHYRFHKINFAAAAQVWRLHPDDIPRIGNSATEIIMALGEGDVIASPRVPVHTTDVTFNTQASGGGTDLLVAEISESGTVAVVGGSTFTLDDTDAPFSTVYRAGKHVVRITDATGTTALAFIGTEDVDGDDTKAQLYTSSDLTTKGYADTETGWDETDTPLTYNVYDVTFELVTGFDGNFRQIKIRNNSGSTGYLTFIQLFGDKGTKANESVARGENAESQTFIGRRRVDHTTLHIDKFRVARRRARSRSAERSIPRERVIVSMTNATQANLMQIIHRQMSDQVDMNYSDMGIDGQYWVEKKTIEMPQEGNTLVEADVELTAVDTWLAGSVTNGARAGLSRAR